MLVKKFGNQQEIIAGDNCVLRELLSCNSDSVESRYSLAWAKVKVGLTTAPHAMKTTEVYCITRGQGIMHIGDESVEVGVYDTVYIPPNAVQYIENTSNEDLEFLCIVDPAWRKEDEVIL